MLTCYENIRGFCWGASHQYCLTLLWWKPTFFKKQLNFSEGLVKTQMQFFSHPNSQLTCTLPADPLSQHHHGVTDSLRRDHEQKPEDLLPQTKSPAHLQTLKEMCPGSNQILLSSHHGQGMESTLRLPPCPAHS